MTQRQVFISYSTRDREVADIVLETLETAGLRGWMAPRDVPPGVSYPEAIISAIRDCEFGLLVLSEQANTSAHVLREVERLTTENKKLYVVRIDPIELSDGLSYFASLLQWVEAPRDRLVRDPVTLLKPVIDAKSAGSAPEKETKASKTGAVGLQKLVGLDAMSETLSFSALAEAQRRMLSTFGVAVLDFVCQQPDPTKPIPRRELLTRLSDSTTGVFDGLSPRQFESLLEDARANGCTPGLSENEFGLFVVEENIVVKRERNQVAKALIARHAAKMVTDGSIVAVDGGSTTHPLVEELLAMVEMGDLQKITIITNSLTSAQSISEFMSAMGWTDESALVSLLLVGGYVRANTHATTWGNSVDRERIELLEDLAKGDRPIDFGFVGGNGFDLNAGVTMGSHNELGFKRFVIEHSVSPFVVADSSKAGITLPVQIADWDDEFTLLTNVLPADSLETLEELVLAGRIFEVRE